MFLKRRRTLKIKGFRIQTESVEIGLKFKRANMEWGYSKLNKIPIDTRKTGTCLLGDKTRYTNFTQIF